MILFSTFWSSIDKWLWLHLIPVGLMVRRYKNYFCIAHNLISLHIRSVWETICDAKLDLLGEPSTQIGTFHGGLRDFGSELTQNTPSLKWNFSWRTFVSRNGVWRLLLYPPRISSPFDVSGNDYSISMRYTCAKCLSVTSVRPSTNIHIMLVSGGNLRALSIPVITCRNIYPERSNSMCSRG